MRFVIFISQADRTVCIIYTLDESATFCLSMFICQFIKSNFLYFRNRANDHFGTQTRFWSFRSRNSTKLVRFCYRFVPQNIYEYVCFLCRYNIIINKFICNSTELDSHILYIQAYTIQGNTNATQRDTYK